MFDFIFGQRVLGLSGGSNADEAPDVILAKQQASYRKAQHKLAQQQKKEEKLKVVHKQMETEQAAIEKQLANAQSDAAKQKAQLAKARNTIKCDFP